MDHPAVPRVEADNSTSSSTSHSVPMDSFLLTANNIFCGVFGIPLNVSLAAYIMLTPRLHRTRNIVWLGVAFSNVLLLFQHLLEFYVYSFQNETAKKIFTLLSGLPVASLMLNLFLSLIDRYVSIALSAWYKRNVTITWIVSGQSGCFSILCVLTKGPYLFKIIPILAGPATTDMKIISTVLLTILLLSLVGQVFVYFKIKYYLNLDKDVDVSLSTHRIVQHNYNANRQRQAINTQATDFMGRETREENSLAELRHHAAAESLQNSAVTPSPYFIHIGDQAISRQELKAARHAVDSVSLFLVFFLPSFVALMFSIFADCSLAIHLIRQ